MCGNPVLLRPHHVLCIAHFIGRGYSKAFTHNMARVITLLHKNDPPVLPVCGTDVLCAACPHNRNGLCEQHGKVRGYDTACLTLCGITENTPLRWSALTRLAHTRILDAGRLGEVCANCEWFSLCSSLRPD